MLKNTEGTIKNGQSRETGDTRVHKTNKYKNKNYNAICVRHHDTSANLNKT